MTSISYAQLVEKEFVRLKVPEHTESMTALEAALSWANCGFYVLPIDNKSKNPGSVVGAGWPDKSSRDTETLSGWFSGSTYGLALHIGKSGAIAFDVDDPSCVPGQLREWMSFEGTPFQSTRKNDPKRGHYLFATVAEANYGNSKGLLRGAWGEVRGRNGIIAVAPTVHQKWADGGQYKWLRTGPLPYLPNEIMKLLPRNSVVASSSVDLSEVEAFMRQHEGSELPHLLEIRLEDANTKLGIGSRHDNTRNLLLTCLREAMAGLYPAQECIESIAGLFTSHKPKSEWTSPGEFIGMVRWAVAQVLETRQEELALIRDTQLLAESAAVAQWLEGLK